MADQVTAGLTKRKLFRVISVVTGHREPNAGLVMQRGITVVALALASVLVFKTFVVGHTKQFADSEVQISTYGLHLARAGEMKSFPTELVPLP